jgi:hypothetical protein
MDKLKSKYIVTREMLITLVNTISTKRNLIFKLDKQDTELQTLIKLNKIFLKLKITKMQLGFNVLDEEIEKLILIDKPSLSCEDISKLYIYLYFYNNTTNITEFPEELNDPALQWQFIKVISNDTQLNNRFSYIDGNLYLNK